MEIFAFMPALMSLIVTLYFLSSIYDKSDEWVWRLWKLIFGIVFVLLTIYLTNLGLKNYRQFNRVIYDTPTQHEYYYDY